MKRIVSVVILLLVTGCAPWVRTEGPVAYDSQNFAVDPPQGWMRRNTDKLFLITRDGLALQAVLIERVNVSDQKQFKYTKKRVTSGMLPNELAETIIDDYQSDADSPLDAVEENAPAKVSDKPGCMVRLTFTNKAGLKYRCLIYGCLVGDWFYRVTYTAPARYYFDRDVAAVQEMMKSFKLTHL